MKTVQRERRNNYEAGPNPRNKHFEIPQAYQDLIFFDSGPEDENRILPLQGWIELPAMPLCATPQQGWPDVLQPPACNGQSHAGSEPFHDSSGL